MSRVEGKTVAAPRTRPGLVGAASRRVLERALSGIADGALEMRAPDGVRRFGDPAAQAAVMEVHDPRFFARLARSGRLAVGEGYQAGEWSSPDLPGLVAVLARNQEQVSAGRRSRCSPGSAGSFRASSCRAACAEPSRTCTPTTTSATRSSRSGWTPP